MKWILMLLAMLFLVLLPVSAYGADGADALKEATKVYRTAMDTETRDARRAAFAQAERAFAGLAESNNIQSASLYLNWGNAALQAEHLGPAILAYRRALELDPGDRQARTNLSEARSVLPTWVPRPNDDSLSSTFFFWARHLSRSARHQLAALLFLMSCILLALWIRWNRVWARNLAIIPMLLWLALLAFPLFGSESSEHAAVVTASEAVVRAADSPGAPRKFSDALPGGTEVTIVESRGPWLRIRLEDGREGWIGGGRLTQVVPSPSNSDAN